MDRTPRPREASFPVPAASTSSAGSSGAGSAATSDDVAASVAASGSASVGRSEEPAWFLDVPVPGAEIDDVGVSVTDDGDLVVDLGPHRRVITLPAVLRRCDVSGATLDLTDDGQVVRVRFDPVLERWTAAVAP